MTKIPEIIKMVTTGKLFAFRKRQVIFIDPNHTIEKLSEQKYLTSFNVWWLSSLLSSSTGKVEYEFNLIAPNSSCWGHDEGIQGFRETFRATFSVDPIGDFFVANLKRIIPVRHRFFHNHGEHYDHLAPLNSILLDSAIVPEVHNG